MNKDERIQLRNNLFSILVSKSIIVYVDRFGGVYKISRKSKLDSLLESDNSIKELYNKYISNYNSEEEALYCLLHSSDPEDNICSICKDRLRFGKFNKKWCYAKTCGKHKCKQAMIHTEEAQRKSEETCMKNHGVKNPGLSKKIMEKVRQTNLAKYGSEYIVETEEFKEKRTKTCTEKYGTNNTTSLPEIKAKIRNTMKERYGAEHSMQVPEIRKKVRQSNLKKFGYEYAMQNEEVQKKTRETNLAKYGYEYVAQVPEFTKKARKTNINRYGYEHPMQNEEVKAKFRKTYISNQYSMLLSECDDKLKELLSNFKNSTLLDIYTSNEQFGKFVQLMYSNKNAPLRLREISSVFKVATTTIKSRLDKLNLLDYVFIREPKLEVQLRELLNSKNIKYDRRDRTIIKPDEIDFVITSTKVGIEVNDLKTHNKKSKGPNYHYNKTKLAASRDIRLVHLWEWEMTDYILWNRISRWILDLCNSNKTIIDISNSNTSKDYIVKLVPIEEERSFLNNYHIQGYIRSEICPGIYKKDTNELLQLMSFGKPRYYNSTNKYDYELLRLCTKYEYNIVNGFSTLLDYFISNSNSNSNITIVSYCNLDKFTGKVYEEIGFKLVDNMSASAIWYNPETTDRFLHSSLVSKGADILLGTNYGKGSSNEEIATKLGYMKIYGCGNSVYEYRR